MTEPNEVNKKTLRRRSIFVPQVRDSHPRTSYLETLVHNLKGNVGSGLFAMGDAFKNGGLYVTPFLIIFLALLCVVCERTLVVKAEQLRKLFEEDSYTDYAETVELCFANGPQKIQPWAKNMRKTVNFFICITQLGFCSVYFVFISSNMVQVLAAYNIKIGIHYVMLIAFIPILLISLITTLKLLMPVSFVANVCMSVGLGITIYYTLKDGLPNVDRLAPYTDISKLALSFSTTIFAFEGIALVLPLRSAMKNPTYFESACGVLNVSIIIMTLMFLAAGFLGFAKWGDDVRGSLTLNVGDTPLAQSVKLIVSLGILMGYPIQLYVAIQIMLPDALRILKCVEKPLLGELIFRTCMVIITLIAAEIVPALGLFISLIGAICSTALALVFPPVIELVLLSLEKRSKTYICCIVLKSIFILIMAVAGCFMGTYISLTELYNYFSKGENTVV